MGVLVVLGVLARRHPSAAASRLPGTKSAPAAPPRNWIFAFNVISLLTTSHQAPGTRHYHLTVTVVTVPSFFVYQNAVPAGTVALPSHDDGR